MAQKHYIFDFDGTPVDDDSSAAFETELRSRDTYIYDFHELLIR